MTLAVFALSSSCAGVGLAPGEEPRFYANRANFGWDTAILERGAGEVQGGVDVDPGETVDAPMTLRLGLTEHTELFSCLAPYRSNLEPGSNPSDFGDVLLGVRHRYHAPEEGPSAAVLFAVNVPFGDEADGFGSGHYDVFGAWMATLESGFLAMTGYYELGLLDPGDTDVLQHSLAFVTEMALTRDLGGFVQVSSILVPEEDVDATETSAGIVVNVSPTVSWDIAASLGLSEEAADFVVSTGFTWGIAPRSARRL